MILESEALLRLGRAQEARAVVERRMARGGVDPNLCLAYANCFADDPSADAVRLEWINRVYVAAGFAPIAKADPHAPLTIDNLKVSVAAPSPIADAARISVIMTVYNAATTVRMATDSVLAQTWPNVELIIVDDASTDGTWEVVRSLAANHPAITAVRQKSNQGAYVARNVGVGRATGDFITTHDGDDWSHPQKIEEQWRQMTSRPDILGSRSFWVRSNRTLRFAVEWQPREQLITLNPSSFMFTRSILTQLGGWDRVRASGDGEFIARAEWAFGANAFVMMRQMVPLAFGLQSQTSLSGRGDTHFDTLHFGLRRDYLDAARWWRQTHPPRIDPGNRSRPFWAPRRLLANTSENPPYDLLFIDDFNRRSGTRTTTMKYIRSGLRGGRRVALFHWHHFAEPGIRRPLDPRIWALAAAGRVDVISAGDEIAADFVVFPFPAILQFPIDKTPVVDFGQLIVIEGELAHGQSETGHQGYDAAVASDVLFATFGDRGTWVPEAGSIPALINAASGGGRVTGAGVRSAGRPQRR